MQMNESAGVQGVIVPVNATPQAPEEAAKGNSTVTMVFDKTVHLTVAPNRSIMFHPGTHEVPEQYADHWYLKAHGARIYARPVAVGEAQPAPSGLVTLSREELLILAKGYGIKIDPRTGPEKLIAKINAAKELKSDLPEDAGTGAEAGDAPKEGEQK
jgi:hypothetical protein